MATTNQIKGWLERAKDKKDVSHVLIVCDQFDYSDYPVEVKNGNINAAISKYHNLSKMSRVMEVFNMAMPIEEQLNNGMVWNVETPAQYLPKLKPITIKESFEKQETKPEPVKEIPKKQADTMVVTPEERILLETLRAAQKIKS